MDTPATVRTSGDRKRGAAGVRAASALEEVHHEGHEDHEAQSPFFKCFMFFIIPLQARFADR
jgi:hypothetical protein